MEGKQATGESFEYTYSAKQQQEIEEIRSRYVPRESDKMEQLRALDRSASRKGRAIALVLGVVGALLLGVGLCCTMVWVDPLFFPGIAMGIIGIALVVAAYPVYTRVTKRERARIAPEILRSIQELSQK